MTVENGFTCGNYSEGEFKQLIIKKARRVVLLMDSSKIDKSLPYTFAEIGDVDAVITMGCNVSCPFLPCEMREDWGLDDPSGKPDEAFEETICLIEEKILDLRERMK